MSNKVLRGDVTIWAAHVDAFANPADPKIAEMNNANLVFNISCAIEDSYTLNATSSATDDSMSVCDTGNVSTPTFANYEASLDGFRDESLSANGVYNRFLRLFRVKNRDFYLIKRLNVAQGTSVAANHVLYLYRVRTDNPQFLADRGEAVRLGARFKPLGEIYQDVKVLS